MKRALALLFVLLLTVSAFVGCDLKAEPSDKEDTAVENNSDKIPYIGANGNWWIGDEDLGVSAKGEKGDKGDDGVTPQIRINSTTNEWEVSTDNGKTWKSTGVKATGSLDNSTNDAPSNTPDDDPTVNPPTDTPDDSGDNESSHTCVDSNKDHYCDEYCGKKLGVHEDKAGDKAHTCAYCGKVAGLCTDTDKNLYCDVCGAYCCSTGLEYLANIDGTTCTVTGLGSCGDTNLFIPSTINGLTVTAIADEAFYWRESLTSVTIPDSVTSIGDWAFYDCSSLTSVTIGNSVTSIGDYAFRNCSSLTSVTIPNSVTSIGSDAFAYSGLISVTLGSGIKSGSIDYDAFYNCYKLVEVINKSSLNITKGSSNNGDVAYYALEVHNGESKIVNKDGYLFYTVDGINYLCGYNGNATELVLPDKYNGQDYKIYKNAFYNNDNIISVVIGSGVIGIDEKAFGGCDKLKSVTFKNPNGWTVGEQSAATSVIADTSMAAKYLTETYIDKVWTRS